MSYSFIVLTIISAIYLFVLVLYKNTQITGKSMSLFLITFAQSVA